MRQESCPLGLSDLPVPVRFKTSETERMSDHVATQCLSKQVLWPGVDAEFRQKWLDEVLLVEERELYSASDIHMLQSLVVGDFGLLLTEDGYATLWVHLKAKDLGEMVRPDVH